MIKFNHTVKPDVCMHILIRFGPNMGTSFMRKMGFKPACQKSTKKRPRARKFGLRAREG